MKLSRVTLDVPYRLPGMPSASYELSDAHCLDMRYDAALQSVVFGETGHGIGWSHVVSWVKADLDLVCTECGKGGFATEKAKSGHMRHCKARKESA